MPDDARVPSIYNDAERFALGQRVASMFAAANLVPEHLRKNVSDCLIALDIAERMGEHPIMVMQNIYFVHGRPGWSAQYTIARVNRSKVFRGPLRWRSEGTGDDLKVTCYADLANVHDEDEARCEVTVSMAMAKADGWTRNEKYTTMPEQMLRYRSATWLTRLYCPEVMMGVPIMDEPDGIIDVTPIPARPLLQEFGRDGFTGPTVDPADIAGASGPAAEVAGEAAAQPAAAQPAPAGGTEPGRLRKRAPRPTSPSAATPAADQSPGASTAAPQPSQEPAPQPQQPAAAAPAETAAAATSTEPSPGPSSTGEPARAEPEPEFDVLVPMNSGVQAWHNPAKARLLAMLNQGRPPADFTRFREVNKDALAKLQQGFDWWHGNLMAEIAKGERGGT